MAIIDQQYNHIGIQTWETKFGADVMGGRGAMVGHPDGYTYAIFARNYQNGVSERRLYMTRTMDKGVTWSDPIQITAGAWDDDPGAIVLDENDVASDIGIAFVRNGYLMRTTINKETGAASAIDYIDNEIMSPTLIRTLDGGYAIFYLYNRSVIYPIVRVARNANEFTMNTWVRSTYSDPRLFPADNTPYSLSVKRMLNGDLMMLLTVRTALNGVASDEYGSNGWSNIARGIQQTNIIVLFSSDDGITWTAPDQLTNYANDTSFGLDGFDSVANCDCVQLTDGRVVVAYEEHKAPILFNSETAPNVPPTWDYTFNVKYHEEKDLIFYSGSNSSTGGIFYFNKSNYNGVHRISTTSTPYIWTNDINTFDISPDGRLLVTGSWTGGLTLIDIADPDPANWKTLYCLHYLSDPGDQLSLLSSKIFLVRFYDNNTVVFSYNEFTGYHNAGGIWRFKLDSERNIITTGDDKHTLTLWQTHAPHNTHNVAFVLQGGRIVAADSSGIASISLETGELQRVTYCSQAVDRIAYDQTHNLFIAATNNSIHFFTDDGNNFNEIDYMNATTNPAWPGASSAYSGGLFKIADQGMLGFRDGRLNWISLSNRKCAGYRNIKSYLRLGDNFYSGHLDYAGINIPGWLTLASFHQIIFIPITKTGKLRYAFFTYDAENKALNKAGVDWYDVCNEIKMGDEVNRVHFSSIIRDLDDRLYLYCTRYDYYHDGNEFGVLVGVIEPDVKKINAKARIQNTYINNVLGKSRIQNTYSSTFNLRVRVAFAQCFKAKARIVPHVNKTFSARAAIKSRKSANTPMFFDVLGTNITRRCRLKFIAQTGYNRTIGLTAKTYIAKTQTTRLTGHFLVAMPPSGEHKPSWNVKNIPQAGIQIRAWISR